MHQRWCTRSDTPEVMHQGWCTRGDATEVMHQRWCTRGDAPEVMHQRWCTRGDAPEVMHQRWYTRGDAPEVMHQRWCTRGWCTRGNAPGVIHQWWRTMSTKGTLVHFHQGRVLTKKHFTLFFRSFKTNPYIKTLGRKFANLILKFIFSIELETDRCLVSCMNKVTDLIWSSQLNVNDCSHSQVRNHS